MLYLSQLQGKQVWDAWSQPIGKCYDVLVGNLDQSFPTVRAIATKAADGAERLIPASQVSGLFPSIILKVPTEEVVPYIPKGDELHLASRVLDRQVVDIDGRRVVRVNDVQLARLRDQFCVTGVDVGGQGLLRRLGLEGVAQGVASRFKRPLPAQVIPWEDVAPLQADDDPLRLRISRDKISHLPGADIAAILNDLDHRTGEALVKGLDNEILADMLEESPAEVQVNILSQLSPERAADVLEEMGPDEAADLLADLPTQTTERLLDLMEDADAEDVRALLAYPEDSAGGIMTTEFAYAPCEMTVGETLAYLRQSEDARDDEVMYYVYLLDKADVLHGVVSLRDLVMAPPDAATDSLIELDPVTVTPLTSQRDVAYLVAKYNVLALPVVEEESGVMLGIVTVDDALDAVLPTAWKKRLPRFF
ncbi:MAG: Magnesium transporter MgtE [Chloroflexi bacterium ADurb.Bin360]|nr:MAG: Magnesium transporter MgtE [Chloroflexi bacterium ADurb.Bin360]